jgi:hypothetical protein
LNSADVVNERHISLFHLCQADFKFFHLLECVLSKEELRLHPD